MEFGRNGVRIKHQKFEKIADFKMKQKVPSLEMRGKGLT